MRKVMSISMVVLMLSILAGAAVLRAQEAAQPILCMALYDEGGVLVWRVITCPGATPVLPTLTPSATPTVAPTSTPTPFATPTVEVATLYPGMCKLQPRWNVNVNIRYGPGTEFQVAGRILVGESVRVYGSTINERGERWMWLAPDASRYCARWVLTLVPGIVCPELVSSGP